MNDIKTVRKNASEMRPTSDFTWKVLLDWATTSDPTPFPGVVNEGTIIIGWD